MSVNESVWRKAVLPLCARIREAIATLNTSGLQIVLVLNEVDMLLGTVTDGDIRRGILRGLSLDDPLHSVMSSSSLVVPPEMSREMVLHLMHANKLRQLPIVSKSHQVVGLHLWDAMLIPTTRANLMIIMAGGLGTRLRPYTESCPKPMLPVAGKPMLEHIIERAKGEGFKHFVIAIQYLGQVIEDYFEDGDRMGVSIVYVRETTPLGTAGALSLLSPKPTLPFVVTNGDVLSDIKYGELLDFHTRHAAVATMAVRLHEWHHPFGVVQTKGIDIVGFEEKPVARSHINAGIYALNPEALQELSTNSHCDMPTLFAQLHSLDKRTVAYPMHEPWLDVGKVDDLHRANTQNNMKH
jgi:dTDP-glucose pyrophosphorylase